MTLTEETTPARVRQAWVVAGALLVTVVMLGVLLTRHTAHRAPAASRAPAPAAALPGGPALVQPPPSSTSGGSRRVAGLRAGFPPSCLGAVQRGTELAADAWRILTSPSAALADSLYPGTATELRALVGALGRGPGSAAQVSAVRAGQILVVHPEWGGFRLVSCQPGQAATVDIWSCLVTHLPEQVNLPPRICSTTSYDLVWLAGDWKESAQFLADPDTPRADHAATTDTFTAHTATTLTRAQRATVIGINPGWQEYTDAPTD